MKYTGYEIRQVCAHMGCIEWVSGRPNETRAEGIVDSRDFSEVVEAYEGITGIKLEQEPGVTDYLDLPVSADEDDEPAVLLAEKSPEFAKLLAICNTAGTDSQVTAGVCATLAVLTRYSGEYFVFKAALLRQLDVEIRKALEAAERIGS